MYSVIIVDDEKWIVEGLKAGIDWEGHNFEVVDAAENGLMALDIIEKKKPNVVFTDIRMPGLNGLELIKKAKEKCPQTIFVVLSGYAEFAYAQKAMNYGAYGYCLKPFEIEEIEGILSKINKHLENSIGKEQNNSIYDYIFSSNFKKVEETLNALDFSLKDNQKYIPIVLTGDHCVTLDDDINNVSFRIGVNNYCYLIYEEDINKFETNYINSFEEYTSAGIGFPIDNLKLIEESIDAAAIASYSLFTIGKNSLAYYDHFDLSLENNLISQISSSLKIEDKISFSQILEKSRAAFKNGKLSIRTAYILFNIITYSDLCKGSCKYIDGYGQLTKYFKNVDAMFDFLKDNTLRYFEGDNAKYNTVEHSTIKDILKYINENITSDFSVQALAKKYYLNPNYMCQLFKKEVGESFIEYISRRRIEYACRLLLETELTINQIGEKCGYNDYFYFTKIFKRHINMTPTQFRASSKA